MSAVCMLSIFVRYSGIIPVIYSFLALPFLHLSPGRPEKLEWFKTPSKCKSADKETVCWREQEGQSGRQPQEEEVRK